MTPYSTICDNKDGVATTSEAPPQQQQHTARSTTSGTTCMRLDASLTPARYTHLCKETRVGRQGGAGAMDVTSHIGGGGRPIVRDTMWTTTAACANGHTAHIGSPIYFTRNSAPHRDTETQRHRDTETQRHRDKDTNKDTATATATDSHTPTQHIGQGWKQGTVHTGPRPHTSQHLRSS